LSNRHAFPEAVAKNLAGSRRCSVLIPGKFKLHQARGLPLGDESIFNGCSGSTVPQAQKINIGLRYQLVYHRGLLEPEGTARPVPGGLQFSTQCT
jgi:hypothetical protein